MDLHADAHLRVLADRVVDRAVVDHGQEGSPEPLIQERGSHHLKPYRRDPRGPGVHGELAPHLEPHDRQGVPSEEPFRVESHAARQSRHEELCGGRPLVTSTRADRLIHEHAVAPNVDLETVAALMPNGHLVHFRPPRSNSIRTSDGERRPSHRLMFSTCAIGAVAYSHVSGSAQGGLPSIVTKLNRHWEQNTSNSAGRCGHSPQAHDRSPSPVAKSYVQPGHWLNPSHRATSAHLPPAGEHMTGWRDHGHRSRHGGAE